MTLSQPTGARIDNQATVANAVIVNDDVAASLTAPGAQSGNEGASVTFNLGTLTDVRPGGAVDDWRELGRLGERDLQRQLGRCIDPRTRLRRQRQLHRDRVGP